MRKEIWIAIAAAAVLLAAAIPLWLVLDDGGERRVGALSTDRSSRGSWALTIDGGLIGGLNSVAGCGIEAPVVSEQITAGQPDKHIGAASPQYENCVIEVGLGMHPNLYKWIADAFSGNQTPKPVVLHLLDAATSPPTEKARLALADTYLTGLRLPALDRASTQPVWLQVTLTPRSIQKAQGSGGAVMVSSSSSKAVLMPGTTVVQIDGIGALSGASVGAWEFEQKVTETDVSGEDRFATKVGQLGAATFGNLIVEFATEPKGGDTTLDALDNYFTSFVIQGEGEEKAATVAVSSSTLAGASKLTLSFPKVGIFGAAQLARAYGFYVESATFEVK